MRVKLLKDHLDVKKEAVIDVTKERGNYFIKVGVAVEFKDKK